MLSGMWLGNKKKRRGAHKITGISRVCLAATTKDQKEQSLQFSVQVFLLSLRICWLQKRTWTPIRRFIFHSIQGGSPPTVVPPETNILNQQILRYRFLLLAFLMVVRCCQTFKKKFGPLLKLIFRKHGIQCVLMAGSKRWAPFPQLFCFPHSLMRPTESIYMIMWVSKLLPDWIGSFCLCNCFCCLSHTLAFFWLRARFCHLLYASTKHGSINSKTIL